MAARHHRLQSRRYTGDRRLPLFAWLAGLPRRPLGTRHEGRFKALVEFGLIERTHIGIGDSGGGFAQLQAGLGAAFRGRLFQPGGFYGPDVIN